MADFAEFLNDDAGAITVDWVALTAGVVVVGMVVVFTVFNAGVRPLVIDINETLATDLPSAEKGQGIDCHIFNSC